MKGDNFRRMTASVQNGSLIAFTNLFCMFIIYYSYFNVLILVLSNHDTAHMKYGFSYLTFRLVVIERNDGSVRLLFQRASRHLHYLSADVPHEVIHHPVGDVVPVAISPHRHSTRSLPAFGTQYSYAPSLRCCTCLSFLKVMLKVFPRVQKLTTNSIFIEHHLT